MFKKTESMQTVKQIIFEIKVERLKFNLFIFTRYNYIFYKEIYI